MHKLFLDLLDWLDQFKTDLIDAIESSGASTQDAIKELHEQLQWEDPEQEAE